MTHLLRDTRWNPIWFGLVLAAAWEAIGRRTSPIILPPLSKVLSILLEYVANGTITQAWLETTRLLMVGLGLGTVSGIVGGVLLGRFVLLEEALDPFLAAAFAMPRIAIMPLIILWFGVTFSGQVAIVFLTSFFEVLVSTVVGVRAVGRTYVEVARAFRVPRWMLIRSVVIPGAIPHIVSGLRLAVGHGLIGVVLAEMFIQATGIGGVILTESQNFRTSGVLASVLTVSVVGVTLNLLLGRLEQKFMPWKSAGA